MMKEVDDECSEFESQFGVVDIGRPLLPRTLTSGVQQMKGVPEKTLVRKELNYKK